MCDVENKLCMIIVSVVFRVTVGKRRARAGGIHRQRLRRWAKATIIDKVSWGIRCMQQTTQIPCRAARQGPARAVPTKAGQSSRGSIFVSQSFRTCHPPTLRHWASPSNISRVFLPLTSLAWRRFPTQASIDYSVVCERVPAGPWTKLLAEENERDQPVTVRTFVCRLRQKAIIYYLRFCGSGATRRSLSAVCLLGDFSVSTIRNFARNFRAG